MSIPSVNTIPATGSPFFRRSHEDVPGGFEPLPHASSRWGADQLRGPALTGLLARSVRGEVTRRTDLQPVRASFELFRAARITTTIARVSVIREGRRLAVIDSQLWQAEQPVARAQIMFIAPTENPPGNLWSPTDRFPVPDADIAADEENRLYRGDDSVWTADAGDVSHATRKHVWQRPFVIVEDEQPSRFEVLACACDMASLVVNWGAAGMRFINAQASVSVSRAFAGDGVGLATGARSANTGISVGSAVVYDRDGVLGIADATALSQPSGVQVGTR